MDDLNLEISDFRQINNAKINVKKINIVGGVNSSGKSTVSKILYCYLKANSIKSKDHAFKEVINFLNDFFYEFEKIIDNPPVANPTKFSLDDDFDEVVKEYKEHRQYFYENQSEFIIKNKNLRETLKIDENMMINRFEEFIDDIDDMLKLIFDDNHKIYSPIIDFMFKAEHLKDFDGKIHFYTDSFDSYMVDVDEFNELSTDPQFDDIEDEINYVSKGSLEFMTDVFYVDSISIFDLYGVFSGKREHLTYLIEALRDFNPDEQLSDSMMMVKEKISEIDGVELSDSHDLEEQFFTSKTDDVIIASNISSGIKQISIIELLLINNKLKPGTFLIIDEPEVNLHPEWQIKFAEILVLLVKDLDIVLYMNSHSPMFIEAVSLYCQYYDLDDQTNVYLTEMQDNGKYDFGRIDIDDMGAVYENLTRPYDELDKLKAKILFKE